MRQPLRLSTPGVLLVASLSLAGCGAGPSSEATGSAGEGVSTACATSASGPVQGVDVSHYQGNFNWNSGRSFGYAAIGDGVGYADPTFSSNWANMEAAGVLRGAYQFFEPADDPTAQANLMVAAVGHLGAGDLPCMIDVEVTGGQSGATIAANVRTWINVVQAGTGLTPIIYTGPYFWDEHVGDTSFGDIPLWIADYGPSCPQIPNGWSTWTIWQYGDGGGALDQDVFNGSLAQLQALTGGAAAAPAPPPAFQFFTGDFNGDGKTDELFYYSGDSNWWMGLSDGTDITWHLAGNTKGFGNLLGGDMQFFTGDFNGDGKQDVAFYYNGDSNWWMGLSDGTDINWHLAGNTKGFGNLLGGDMQFFTGDFNGDGKQDVAFYYNGDSNWWMGLSDGTDINWHLAGNTKGFGNLLGGGMKFFTGDFNGDGKQDVAFYYKGDSNWWMGLSDGTDINWHLAGNTKGFGNLLGGDMQFFTGDFNGDGKQDVAFYYNGDSNWWMGLSDGTDITWHLAGNTKGFGNLLGGGMKFFSGDFNGDGKQDVAFYYNGDSNWWIGLSDGTDITWHLAGNTKGFGNLLGGDMKFFTGDFNGDKKTDVTFYYNGDSNWWMGLSDGTDIDWHLAGNTKGFGNLLALQ